MSWVHGQGAWGTYPVEPSGKAPVRVLGNKVPQKLKQNVKLVYNL